MLPKGVVLATADHAEFTDGLLALPLPGGRLLITTASAENVRTDAQCKELTVATSISHPELGVVLGFVTLLPPPAHPSLIVGAVRCVCAPVASESPP